MLIEALSRSSRRRLDRYRAALTDLGDLGVVVAQLETLYAEDRSEGHLTVLAELVGGITASPDLQVGIERATQPWLEFVEQTIRDASAGNSVAGLVPAEDLADLIFSLVIGVELRNRIDGRTERADRLFRLASLIATVAQSSTSPTP